MRFAFALGVLTWVGCGLAEPRVGQWVSPGAAEAVFEQRVNGSSLLRTRVVFPANDDGSPRAGPFPAVVFIQGGLVPERRYRWWAEGLARAGFVVALPVHDLSLAIFSIDSGAHARELLVNPPPSVLTTLVDPRRIAVAGHSLGGVVASKLSLQGGFGALLLHASLPDAPDEAPLRASKLPSLSLAGKNDCTSKVDAVTQGAAKLGTPSALVVLDGVTHYQFTDSDREDVTRGCASGVDLETAHARILAVSIAFLDAALSAMPAVDSPALRAVAGAEVTTR